MKPFKILFATIFLFSGYILTAQVAINTDGTPPDASAILEIKSTSKGMLIPRMTENQMEGIPNPAKGLSVYNTDVKAVCYYNGNGWDCMDSQFLFNITFSCGDELRDFRDGKAYATVQIGTQCWMAENMNVGTRIDESEDQTDNNTIEKYCYTIGPLSFCDDYGGLYQWDEMMQYVTTEGAQGICPEGWHLPSDAEWKTMEMYLGMPQEDANRIGCRGTDEGGKLKETGTSHWLSPNTGASNSSGFTAVGGGFSDKGTPAFYNLNAYGYFWSSSKIGSYAWHRHLFYDDAMINRFKYILTMGYSVRCVRD